MNQPTLEFDPEVDAAILRDTNLLDDTVPIEDLDTFVRHLTAWHEVKVKALNHLLQIPEGTIFTIGDEDDEEELLLEGSAHAGFLFGIELALMQVKDLPFVMELEDEVTASDDAA